MSEIDLDALERMAKAAGADAGLGTWDATDCVVWFPDGDGAVEVGYSKPRPVGPTFANVGAWPEMIDESQVADFIAAACPDAVLAMIASIRAVEAERDALRADAARYRCLRNSSCGQYEHPIVVSQNRTGMKMTYVGPLIGDGLDSAIDAAIAAKESQS